jgi:hypothetical protein
MKLPVTQQLETTQSLQRALDNEVNRTRFNSGSVYHSSSAVAKSTSEHKSVLSGLAVSRKRWLSTLDSLNCPDVIVQFSPALL